MTLASGGATATTTPTRHGATRPCAISRAAPSSPAGYAALLLLAYLPPLWFRLIDPRGLAHYGQQLERANLQPGREAALRQRLARRQT